MRRKYKWMKRNDSKNVNVEIKMKENLYSTPYNFKEYVLLIFINNRRKSRVLWKHVFKDIFCLPVTWIEIWNLLEKVGKHFDYLNMSFLSKEDKTEQYFTL